MENPIQNPTPAAAPVEAKKSPVKLIVIVAVVVVVLVAAYFLFIK